MITKHTYSLALADDSHHSDCQNQTNGANSVSKSKQAITTHQNFSVWMAGRRQEIDLDSMLGNSYFPSSYLLRTDWRFPGSSFSTEPLPRVGIFHGYSVIFGFTCSFSCYCQEISIQITLNTITLVLFVNICFNPFLLHITLAQTLTCGQYKLYPIAMQSINASYVCGVKGQRAGPLIEGFSKAMSQDDKCYPINNQSVSTYSVLLLLW